jgi:hypothetical protein
MHPTVTVLDWDSEFFGFPIGSVALEGATEESLHGIDEQARDLGLHCVYGALHEVDTTTSFVVQGGGFRFVEAAMRLGRPAGPFETRPTSSTWRRGTPEDLDRLGPSIDTLAPWSRFAADPRFGADAAARLFRAWVERAARDGDEHLLLVTEDPSGAITGLSTNVRHPVHRVDLMGVIEQGSGAAWQLMEGLLDWADGGAVEAGPCAARNVAPIRYLEHCGFSVVASEYRFHRWYTDA